MTERKTLTITSVEGIKKVGDRQVPKLSFKARDGDKELSFFSFRQSLFEAIKSGETITADVDIKTREYEGNTYTDRAVVQIYKGGQPVAVKAGFCSSKNPEELDRAAKSMCLAYANDLAVANLIPVAQILVHAQTFYEWVKGSSTTAIVTSISDPVADAALPAQETAAKEQIPSGHKVQNVTELKALMAKHKIPTGEAYEILSIKSFLELTDLDEAWQKIKQARRIP